MGVENKPTGVTRAVRKAFTAGVPRMEIKGYDPKLVSRAIGYLRANGEETYPVGSYVQSEDQIAKFTSARRGSRMKPELLEAQSHTWKIILPFVQRNAAAFEIVELTGLGEYRVNSSINHNKTGTQKFDPYFSPEWTSE